MRNFWQLPFLKLPSIMDRPSLLATLRKQTLNQVHSQVASKNMPACPQELMRLKKIMQKEAAEMQEAYDKWQEALDRVNAARAVTEAAKKAETRMM